MAHDGQKVASRAWVLQLSADAGTTFLQLICEKGTDFDSTWDEIDASSKCGDDTAFSNIKEALNTTFYLIEGENVLSTEASYKLMYQWLRADTTLYFKYGPAGTLATGALRLSGTAHIRSLKLKGQDKDKITIDAEIPVYSANTVLNVGS